MKQISDKTDGYNEIDSQSSKAFFTDSTYFALVAITVTETNCKASNLILISLVERCKLYHRESNVSVKYEHHKIK